ncbi:hypothetical protein EGY25_01095 [Brevundimonas intermedia]|uniref:Uncharacterized protein n=1 Tax=Brevundimonas intermedia TaxID=74315 RepID=A0A4Y9S6R1_9CAUL|nr:hypothetical protein [Brevundimonas intermedia]TFW15218.1 hypothetical protein EGY25_01095 [Brevundimonas intermedia]
MSAGSMLRALTPLGWWAAGVATLALSFALLGGLGFRWDPLDLQQKRLETARSQARDAVAVATAQADARRIETAGAAAQAVRVDHYQHRTTAVERATATAVTQARSADDADHPLEHRRADRLCRHDRELCRLAPDLDGCAGAADVAGGGEAAVRPGDPAA